LCAAPTGSMSAARRSTIAAIFNFNSVVSGPRPGRRDAARQRPAVGAVRWRPRASRRLRSAVASDGAAPAESRRAARVRSTENAPEISLVLTRYLSSGWCLQDFISSQGCGAALETAQSDAGDRLIQVVFEATLARPQRSWQIVPALAVGTIAGAKASPTTNCACRGDDAGRSAPASTCLDWSAVRRWRAFVGWSDAARWPLVPGCSSAAARAGNRFGSLGARPELRVLQSR